MSPIGAPPMSSKSFKTSTRIATDYCRSIVFIHGLQGHPYKTWASKTANRDLSSTAVSSDETSKDRNGSRHPYHRVVPRFSGRVSNLSSTRSNASHRSRDSGGTKESQNFWPKDMLPNQYPKARILVYGYDTKVTKYLSAPTNESSIHSHGKDLLSSLAASRKLDRPLILIAHSLGGIVIKEMLASSSNSIEDRLENVVASTVAVIFLGTPHRGSPDLAAIGDRARSVLSAFRLRTNPAILDALRLKTKDLERAQESFSAVWRQYGFRVKTFQEGLGLTGLNFGPLGRKVVPDFSSLLGDDRERAETIQANHMDMCRVTGPHDPNFDRICGEITSIYNALAGLNATTAHQADSQLLQVNMLAASSHEGRSEYTCEHEKTCLASLLFPNMNQRSQNLENPAEGTCSWFFSHAAFLDWIAHKNQAQSCGLLWLRGKPGSGKSTLLKEAFSRVTKETSGSGCHVVAFFFNAKGDNLEHSPSGMLRSILHQLCSQDRNLLKTLLGFARSRRALYGEDVAPWDEAELRAFFRSAIICQKAGLIIFIDAIDECNSNYARDIADFWRETTKTAYCAGIRLSVCLSSRHFPAITVRNCPEVIMEDHNHPDIIAFVGRRLDLGMTGRYEDQQAIQKKIIEKSGGVFLWVSLVVKDILRKSDEGTGLKSLLNHLESVPQKLEDLFFQLLTSGPFSAMAVRMFQWALLPTKPLRLHEWHHILAFIGATPPSSLHQWRQSDTYTETDEQLEKRVKHLSRGLLTFSIRSSNDHEPVDDAMSDRAGAGSLDLDTGETRVVQVIHESVRQYFLEGPGFAVLDPACAEKPLAHAHLSIMSVCLDYILITELDALVDARDQAQRRAINQRGQPEDRNHHSAKVELSTSTFLYPADSSWPTLSAQPMPRNDISCDLYQQRPPARSGSPVSVASFGSAGSYSSHTARAFESVTRAEISPKGSNKSRLDGSPFPTPHIQRKDTGPSVYNVLKKSSGPVQAYDIASWRLGNRSVTGQACYDELAGHNSPQASITGCSEILEDYAALLSYALFEIFAHAKKADAEDLDPSHIIRRFLLASGWRRWTLLREDVGGRTVSFLYHVADLGLSSWLKAKGPWSPNLISLAIEQAIKYDNSEVLGKLLDAFPSAGCARDVGSGIVQVLARTADAALLQTYLSRHLSQKDDSMNSTMTLKDILEGKDEEGRTALHLAVMEQNKAGVLALLAHGADVSAVDLKLRTPLHLACMNKTRTANRSSSDESTSRDILTPCTDIIEVLLAYHAQIDAVDENGRTPLHITCLNNALPPRQNMSEDPSSPGVQSGRGDFSAVDTLLKHGASVTVGDSMGSLPLHEACWAISGRQSKVSIVSKLLDYGSPVNGVGSRNGTPLHVACFYTDVQVVGELLRRGADPISRDTEGCSPLQIAAAFSSAQVVETLLLFPGTFVDVTDDNGSTPLHMACNPNSIANQNDLTGLSIVRRLLAHGAKAHTIRNRMGYSPADVAMHFDFKEAFEMLARESCDAPFRELS